MSVGRGRSPLVSPHSTHNWECAANPASHGLIGPLTDWGVAPAPSARVSPQLSDGRPALPAWTAQGAAPAERSPDSRLHAPPPAQHSLIREHLGNMATPLKSAHLRFTVFVTFNWVTVLLGTRPRNFQPRSNFWSALSMYRRPHTHIYKAARL